MSRPRPTGALVALAALVLALAGCDSERRAISRDDLPDVPQEPTVVVELDDDGFDVDELEITTEDLVEFVNTGDDDHGVRTGDFRIDTGLLLPGESTFVVFDEEDRYDVVDVADDGHTLTVSATEPVPDD